MSELGGRTTSPAVGLGQQHAQTNNADVASLASQQSQAHTYNSNTHRIQHHNQVGSSLGHSVVPDLMRVYESLTQSSTPQSNNCLQVPLPAPVAAPQPLPSMPQLQLSSAQHETPSDFNQQQEDPQQHQSNQFLLLNHQYKQPERQPQYVNQYSQFPSQQDYHSHQSGAPYISQPQQSSSNNISNNTIHPNIIASERTPPQPDDDMNEIPSLKRNRDDDDKGATNRKKSSSDGRWSKRFTWPNDLHRDFVSAIFDVGLKHASPSALLEFMPHHQQITSERVKSHLQKYRLHRSKSKKEFMSSYDSSIKNLQIGGLKSSVKSLSSGEVAAHLSFSAISEIDEINPLAPQPNPAPTQGSSAAKMHHTAEAIPPETFEQGGALFLPQLTDAEKQSPVGASMGYLMGLFFSMRQQLMHNRSIEDGHQAAASDITDHGMQHHQIMPVPVSVDTSFNTMTTHQEIPEQPHVQKPSQSASPEKQQLIEMATQMASQMAFQNKMRAMKQQELNKYKSVTSIQERSANGTNAVPQGGQAQSFSNMPPDEQDSKDASAVVGGGGASAKSQSETVSVPKSHGLGIAFGNPEEFWNSEAVDDHLFEFLMNTT